MIGVGAMLHYLSGGSEQSADQYYGMKISTVVMSEDKLNITFENGTSISVWDNGQSCCESRYMTTDDDVQSLVGGVLKHIVAKDVKDIEDDEWGDVHESVFVEVGTDQGFVTIVNHNVHNGYYGGFGLTITEKSK